MEINKLPSKPPLLTLYAADESKEKEKKKVTFVRAGSWSRTDRGDKGVLTGGADFGINIFPKFQIITLEFTI